MLINLNEEQRQRIGAVLSMTGIDNELIKAINEPLAIVYEAAYGDVEGDHERIVFHDLSRAVAQALRWVDNERPDTLRSWDFTPLPEELWPAERYRQVMKIWSDSRFHGGYDGYIKVMRVEVQS